jgi:hypothetical protein
LRAELATAQRDLGKRQEAQTAAETALLRAQELAAKDQAARQAELERARAAAQGQMGEAKAEIRRLQQVK